jgi:hypothetical protein
MSKLIAPMFSKLAAAVSIPVILSDFFSREIGKEYGVGFFKKVQLVRKMRRNRSRIPTASHFLEHLLMATEILKVPPSVPGSVVECGSFKGGSAANLSLVCRLCDRRLEIFDSFAGLPQPQPGDQDHVLVGTREIHTYSRGAFLGTLQEVRNNIAWYGDVTVCEFHPGYFEQTLPAFQTNCVLIFVDVDLVASLETCLRHLWPRLKDGGYLFTHEAHHMEIASLFFHEQWWRSHLNCAAPGLVGSGRGIGLRPAAGGFNSCIGYTVKNPDIAEFEHQPQTGNLAR